jgi:hypothetical protein
VGSDLDRHTKKAAVAAISMPPLTDGGSRLSMIIRSSDRNPLQYNRSGRLPPLE